MNFTERAISSSVSMESDIEEIAWTTVPCVLPPKLFPISSRECFVSFREANIATCRAKAMPIVRLDPKISATSTL